MEVRFSRQFVKQYNRAPVRIRQAFNNRLKIFFMNPYAFSLNNHQLLGKLKGLRSINVTGDWRALYSRQDGVLIVFEVLGTHSQLYK
jgi:addiction module RelE/StbE family toxin